MGIKTPPRYQKVTSSINWSTFLIQGSHKSSPLAPGATNSVADAVDHAACLELFRRSIDMKGYTSTSLHRPKVHKRALQWTIFATESNDGFEGR